MRRPKERRPALSPEDEALWQLVTRDVKPIERGKLRPGVGGVPKKALARPPQRMEKIIAPPSQTRMPLPDSESSHQLNGGWERKLRRGRVEVEARIDLHGMTREAAFAMLTRLISAAIVQEKRSLLVITGKGGRRLAGESGEAATGVLNREIPRWLRLGPLAPHILAVERAHPRDGGGGAYYVVLRRRRLDRELSRP